MPPYSKKAKFTHKKVEDKENFDQRSFRVILWGKKGKKATIGCPNNPDGKSNWMPRKKKCKVGTKVQKIMTPKKIKKSTKKR